MTKASQIEKYFYITPISFNFVGGEEFFHKSFFRFSLKMFGKTVRG